MFPISFANLMSPVHSSDRTGPEHRNGSTIDNKINGASVPTLARLAVAGVFLVNGIVQANWVARIPAVQSHLGANNGQLGLALFGLPIGLLIAAPLSGWLVSRAGSRLITTLAGTIYCLILPLVALAPRIWLLMLTLAAFGAAGGALDVAMNTEAIMVEREYRRPIMVAFHGLFSLGGLIGAGIGSGIAALGVAVSWHFLVIGTAMALGVVLASHWLLPPNAEVVTGGPVFIRPSRALLGLSIVAICALFGEGSVADWSAVYLTRTLHSGPGLAATGFAAFSLTMAAGRFLGDRANRRFGPSQVVRLGGAIAALGMLVVVLSPWTYLALAGFAGIGAGLSVIFPTAITAAGQAHRHEADQMPPSAAIAAVTTAGYVGFLIGPPLIGSVAQLASLRVALAIVVGLGVVIVALAGTVRFPAE